MPYILIGYMMGFHQETKEMLHFEVCVLVQNSIDVYAEIYNFLPLRGISLCNVPLLRIYGY